MHTTTSGSAASADDQAASENAALVDADVIGRTVERALARRAALPPFQELLDLEEILRGHIELLAPIVEAQAARMNRGNTAWYQRRSSLDRARRALSDSMGAGLQSADIHIRELGRVCRSLLDYEQGLR
ncbi:DUF6415 family natural product biosynthesis protein [Streptomyces sp. NPDC004647]|uniref:DUF6415 family natural product biosynthesis protein n=1 Tax=Streptomyces sp. NPDC004647 TaxID=3154671 RepID=UPI0033ACA06E